jgi:hypothetical protein
MVIPFIFISTLPSYTILCKNGNFPASIAKFCQLLPVNALGYRLLYEGRSEFQKASPEEFRAHD